MPPPLFRSTHWEKSPPKEQKSRYGPGGKRLPTVEDASPAGQLFQGQRHPKNRKRLPRLEQWIEVRRMHGKTITKLFPSNEKLVKRGQEMLPPPQRVYRRINFPNGVPDEYLWLGVRDEHHRKNGGMCLQRMTINMWLDAIKKEALRGDGHIGPVFNLPDEAGECECPCCSNSRRLLDEVLADHSAAGLPTDYDSLVAECARRGRAALATAQAGPDQIGAGAKKTEDKEEDKELLDEALTD